MATIIYQCKKCGLSVQKDSSSCYPSTSGCITNGGSHSWTYTRV